MAVRYLWLLGSGLATCLVLCGNGYPQPPSGPATPPLPVLPSAPPPNIPEPVTSLRPSTVSVEQLLDRLIELRRQKAELDKQEQLVVKQLRDKLKAQSELLEKLGIAPEVKKPSDVKASAPAPVPVDLPKDPR